jgi:hypothetical protein
MSECIRRPARGDPAYHSKPNASETLAHLSPMPRLYRLRLRLYVVAGYALVRRTGRWDCGDVFGRQEWWVCVYVYGREMRAVIDV